jgi:hypothetical protein
LLQPRGIRGFGVKDCQRVGAGGKRIGDATEDFGGFGGRRDGDRQRFNFENA